MQSKDEILTVLSKLLIDDFGIEPQNISLSTELYGELDLDSIDAVDLMVSLRKITGKKIAPETFKQVRTVADVVDAVADILALS